MADNFALQILGRDDKTTTNIELLMKAMHKTQQRKSFNAHPISYVENELNNNETQEYKNTRMILSLRSVLQNRVLHFCFAMVSCSTVTDFVFQNGRSKDYLNKKCMIVHKVDV